jgi:putative amino-acid transport system substrate-binding protein/putative amino-acid transport system permease protein
MLKNKKLSAILSLGLVLMIGATGCAKKAPAAAKAEEPTQVIRIGTSGGYYPFTFVENDKLQGFEIDVWNEIAKRIGYKTEFVTSKFSGLFGMLDTDKIDTVANQIATTEERKQKYLFTDPYVYSGAQIIVKKGNTSIKTLEDLKGKKVGVSLGSNFEKTLRAFDKDNKINIVTYDGNGVWQDLALGRIDAMLFDKVSSLVTIKKSNYDLELAGDQLEVGGNAFPFVNNDKNKALIEKVNKALTDMNQDGTLETISKKWVDLDITKK